MSSGTQWAGWALAMAALVAAPAQAAGLYEKHAGWPETMRASRAAYEAWCASDAGQARLELGPWHVTEPLKVIEFKHARFPEKDIDLAATDLQGAPQWRARPDLEDGRVHSLPGKDGAATYLYRTITAAQAISVEAHFGSDDGLAVWLNGTQILARDVARGPAPNQDHATLALKQGENGLLLKIYNRTGGHGFYFAMDADPLPGVWAEVTRDFPVEAEAMRRDAPDGAPLAWFQGAKSAAVEEAMLTHVLEQIGEAAGPLKAGLEAQADVDRLALYAEAAGLRTRLGKAREQLKRLDVAALRRAVDDLCATFPESYGDGAEFLAAVRDFEARAPEIAAALERGELEAIEAVSGFGALRTQALLANPLLDFDRLLVVKRRLDRLGLPQNWQGNCALPRNGYDNEIATLSPVSPEGALTTLYRPEGSEFVGDVDLHFGGDRMLFSMPGSHSRWQIWEMNADGSGLRQVTPGAYRDVDNYDACYLPDGRIVFASTRCFQGIPCVGGGDTVANLCLMHADGSGIRQLCFDQDHNWCPTVLNNGRVLFTRWEYSDTPHYFTRLLFHMNPDGTGQMEYYGSNSFWPNSTFYARPIPGDPSKVVAIVSGHHGVPRMGELVVFDPAKGRHEAQGTVQRIPGYGEPVEPKIVDQLVNSSWPKFLHPYPLSEKYFLVSCQPTPQDAWGVYLADVFDNLLLIKEVAGYALLEPVPLRATPTPPAIPDKVQPETRDGLVYLVDVYAGQGLKGLPRGTVKKLRLYEFHYAYPKMGGHINVGVEGAWDVHRILGTVPVYPDGSALFRVPANTPIAVQPLDEDGRALQLMRSWFVTMPGETLSCVGCHEKQNETAPPKGTMASKQAPSEIAPWHGPARGFSFKRDVQPVLNAYCVGCHDGDSKLDLREQEKNGWGNFTPSYLALHPYVRRPGPESDYHVFKPLEYHANTSELIQMMEKRHHGVELDAEAMERLATWIDLNVPDHGTWHEHREIPADFHARRLEMRTRYANRPEDPEVIPALDLQPASFVKPEPLPRSDAPPSCASWPFGAEQAQAMQAQAGDAARRAVALCGDVSLELTLIPAGEFWMGANEGPADNRPGHCVRIEQPFWMGTTEVTCAQYACFDPAHDNGFFDQHHKDHTTPGYPAHAADKPAIRVTWEEASAYCRWLSERTGETFVLPTEAQWEWACRAGTATALNYGDCDVDFAGVANLADANLTKMAVTGVNPQPIKNPNAYQDFLPKDARFDDGHMLMAPVAQYAPNAWGLYDMHGNVSEWTRSAYEPYPYDALDGRNGGEIEGRKVARGGSWRDRPKRAASHFRYAYYPWQPVFNVGFRVVCLPAEPAAAQVAAR